MIPFLPTRSQSPLRGRMKKEISKNSLVLSANRSVLDWFNVEGRDLPWRTTRDPYSILISEIMLQQTQVNRVIPFYYRFIKLFPTFEALARAPLADVIRSWSGLGYNRRAINLHETAKFVAEYLGGELPNSQERLMEFKGIGSYTASAIGCFAFDSAVPVLDTNTKRVLSRFIFGIKPPSLKQLTTMASTMVPTDRAWGWNQALIDLGAMICLPNAPKCQSCPLQPTCKASKYLTSRALEFSKKLKPLHAVARPFSESRRYFRGRVLAFLSQLDGKETIEISKLGGRLHKNFSEEHYPWLLELLGQLQKEGLVSFTNGTKEISLPRSA